MIEQNLITELKIILHVYLLCRFAVLTSYTMFHAIMYLRKLPFVIVWKLADIY